jgi:DNA-binding response OmpR family regulator
MKSVLIVDDDELLRNALTSALKEANFNAVGAADGETALSKAEANPPNLIILDERMPGMSGSEFLEKLRAQAWGQDIDVIVLTGSQDVSQINQKLARGVADYLDKASMTPEKIVTLVKNHLAH